MPYIKQEDRKPDSLSNPGKLNYMMTKLIMRYLEENSFNYQSINDVVGALECCKMELYRRKVAPYENSKMAENGDVYIEGEMDLAKWAEEKGYL